MDQELEIVYAAIDEVNATSGGDHLIAKAVDTPLLGSDTGVDSLAFVNLIVAIENEVQSRLKTTVILVDETSMSGDEHPFRTVGSLVAYLRRRLQS
jgi:acyl carrier protein